MTALRHRSGRVDHCLGGAATYFALAASYFTQVRVIGVVGEDFTAENEAVLTKRGVDTTGWSMYGGKSFHWTGSYTENLNEAQTLNTELNVFETFTPKIPASYRGQRISLSGEYRSGAAGECAQPDAEGEDGVRRHHELLDHRTTAKTGRGAGGPGCAADQRWRSQDAGRRTPTW